MTNLWYSPLKKKSSFLITLKNQVSKDKYKQSIYHWNILQYLKITFTIHCY